MSSDENGTNWIWRILVAIVIAASVFIILQLLYTELGLSMPVRIGISAACGILYLIFGGSIWDWISQFAPWD
jgi:hypothetical protein